MDACDNATLRSAELQAPRAPTSLHIILVSSSIVAFACASLLLVALLQPQGREQPNKYVTLVIFLTLSDTTNTLKQFVDGVLALSVSDYDDMCWAPAACAALGALDQFSAFAGLMWHACIAFTVHFNVHASGSRSRWCAQEMPLVAMHAFVWGSSAVVVCVLFGLNAFGWSGTYCWIKQSNDSLWLPSFYIPAAVVIVYTLVTSAALRLTLRRVANSLNSGDELGGASRNSDNLAQLMMAVNLRVANVILALGGLLSILLANRLVVLLRGESPLVLQLVVSFVSPLKPMASILIYGRQEMRRFLWRLRCFRCCFRCALGREAYARFRELRLRPSCDELRGSAGSANSSKMLTLSVSSVQPNMGTIATEGARIENRV